MITSCPFIIASSLLCCRKQNKDGTGYAVLHHFLADGSGQIPESGVIEGWDGAFYGTTLQGGSGSGTVFGLSKDGTGYRIVHSFDFTPDNGRSPRTGLILGSDGALYGSTMLGGTRDEGTVFRLKSDGSGFRILHRFVRSAGVTDFPSPTRLFAGLDGALYGATISGDQYGAGTVFRLVPPPDTMTIGLLSNGAAQLAVRGLSGQTLKIESSDDLGTWRTFTTGTVTNGSLEVRDTDIVGTGRQFYRARSEP
jgi:uncharacterized repeat protein (TIGR03803 family)